MIFFANFCLLTAGAFLIWKEQPRQIRAWYFPAFGLKLLAGIGLGLVYQYYYSEGDTFYLFEQARQQAEQFYQSPATYIDFLLSTEGEEWKGQLRSSFFVKIISVPAIISGGNYWITCCWFSFATFLSSWYIFKTADRHFSDSRFAAALAFLFFPSVVFWSSGIIKESFALAGLYLMAGVWLKGMVREKTHFWEYLAAVAGLWVVWNLKYYWAAVFLPVAAISIVTQTYGTRVNPITGLVIWPLLVVIIAVAVQFIHPNFYPGNFLNVLVNNHNAFIPLSHPKNLIHYYNLHPSWLSVMINSPWALFSGLFRPLPGEAHGILAWIPAIENAVILILVVASLNIHRIQTSPYKGIVVSVLVYSFVLCVFLSLSTPNFGSLARYKVGFMPFFIFVISYGNPLLLWLTGRLTKEFPRVGAHS